MAYGHALANLLQLQALESYLASNPAPSPDEKAATAPRVPQQRDPKSTPARPAR